MKASGGKSEKGLSFTSVGDEKRTEETEWKSTRRALMKSFFPLKSSRVKKIVEFNDKVLLRTECFCQAKSAIGCVRPKKLKNVMRQHIRRTSNQMKQERAFC